MPELPDVTVYVEAIARRVVGVRLQDVRIDHPFTLRTVDPPVTEARGRQVVGVRRIGKRIAIELEHGLFLVVHLMIAGRFAWIGAGSKKAPRKGLVGFEFESGVLTLTEAGSRRRASLVLARGESGLAELDRGGIEPLVADVPEFQRALSRENHTLKRALTDPRIVSGIGNAYSDEILHAARLSPLKLTNALTAPEWARLHAAVRSTLTQWTDRLRAECGDGFPAHVTAFRAEMAVHGKFGEPCPVCHAPVQRIVWTDRECNYCARCQTEGRLLSDRALSRLLKDDWPRTIEELEERNRRR